jgi:site-specific DNA recombinase
VLLSFAQFEREVTAERIRDKIAASRKKGIWMGGTVPLGYRAVDKKLVIDPEAANKVRGIFSRYLELKSAPVLVDELNGEGDVDTTSSPSRQGRLPFTRGKLYHLLSNVVYIGKARHKDRIYDGEHAAIIDDETFSAVQTLLKTQAPVRRNGSNVRNRHLLTGLLFDETGDRLSPVFTVKDGKRYRYYISTGWRPRPETILPVGACRPTSWSGQFFTNWMRCFGTRSRCPNGPACWCLQCRCIPPSPGQGRSVMRSRSHPQNRHSH